MISDGQRIEQECCVELVQLCIITANLLYQLNFLDHLRSSILGRRVSSQWRIRIRGNLFVLLSLVEFQALFFVCAAMLGLLDWDLSGT